MLIRLKVPVFTEQTEVKLSQERVINYLGGKVMIQISVKLTTIVLAVRVIKEEYSQMKLEWDNESAK